MPNKKNLGQNISDSFRLQIEIISGPFVKDTNGAANRAGDHIRNFFLCVFIWAGIGCGISDVVMEHGQHFFKQVIAMRCAQKTCKKRILYGVLTD